MVKLSLAIKYENAEDAKMRLRHTVVLYKGEPVYINDVQRGNGDDDGPLRVYMTALPVTGKAPVPQEEGVAGQQRKFISSKHFDIAPFRMGYVNDPKYGAYYCSRLPNRVQKQGLCNENFKAVTNAGAPIAFATFTACKDVPAMVANNYPSFERCATLLAKCSSMAFHRDFALMRDKDLPDLIFLYHKAQKVGMFMRDQITLGPKFQCLKESLDEMRLAVGVR